MTRTNGILVETTVLLDRVHDRLDAAHKLVSQGNKAEAAPLFDAAVSVVSALMSRDLTSRYVTLPESVRPFFNRIMLDA